MILFFPPSFPFLSIKENCHARGPGDRTHCGGKGYLQRSFETHLSAGRGRCRENHGSLMIMVYHSVSKIWVCLKMGYTGIPWYTLQIGKYVCFGKWWWTNQPMDFGVAYFQTHIPTYSNIFQHIPTYSNIFQHIPTSSWHGGVRDVGVPCDSWPQDLNEAGRRRRKPGVRPCRFACVSTLRRTAAESVARLSRLSPKLAWKGCEWV
jgi:hypothetical protein